MKVLVATESRHGATAEIGQAIADVLERDGHEVEQRRLHEVDTVMPYEAFVLGSGIYMGSWLRPAREFLHEHAECLSIRPTWLFSSGPVGERTGDGFEADALVALVHARDHQLFGGRLDSSLLALRERTVTKLLRVSDGDYRAWESVIAWATAIARTLAENPQPLAGRS